MNVLFITTHKYLPEVLGGMEKSTHEICKKLIEQCVCVCPYCGERDKCECALFDAATGA